MAAEIDQVAAGLAASADANLKAIGRSLADANAALERAIDWVVPAYGAHPRAAHAAAVPYLELWGLVAGGWQLGRAALAAAKHLAAGTGDARFLHAKIVTARYYADAILPQAASLAVTIAQAGDSTLALAAEQF